MIFGDPPGASPIALIGELEETAVKLQPINVERGGQFNPLADGHRSIDAQRIQKRFGKGCELGHDWLLTRKTGEKEKRLLRKVQAGIVDGESDPRCGKAQGLSYQV